MICRPGPLPMSRSHKQSPENHRFVPPSAQPPHPPPSSRQKSGKPAGKEGRQLVWRWFGALFGQFGPAVRAGDRANSVLAVTCDHSAGWCVFLTPEW